MADEGDMALALTELERDRTIARHRERRRAEGRADCVLCGEPIAPARRAANPHAVACIDCQDETEGMACRNG